jgi:hypothetical protein
MDYDVDAIHGAIEAVAIAHVTDEVPQARIALFAEHLPHIELFEFVATEDDQLSGRVFPQHDVNKLLAERPRAARDQYDFTFEYISATFHLVLATPPIYLLRKASPPSVL